MRVLRPGFVKGFTSLLQMLNSMLSKVAGQSGSDLPCSGTAWGIWYCNLIQTASNAVWQVSRQQCSKNYEYAHIRGISIKHSKAQMLRRSSGGSGSKKVNLEGGCCTRLARSACGAARFYMLAVKKGRQQFKSSCSMTLLDPNQHSWFRGARTNLASSPLPAFKASTLSAPLTAARLATAGAAAAASAFSGSAATPAASSLIPERWPRLNTLSSPLDNF